jgi:acetyltransferase
MAILPAHPGMFRPEMLFRPRHVAVIGPDSAAGAQVLANLAAGGFAGEVWPVARAAELAQAPDIAVVCALEGGLAEAFAALARLGTRLAVVVCMADGVAAAARAAGIRVLGPGSFGIAVPGRGLNASRAHMAVPAGRLALVSQSAALCRAVLDWAGPNGVGFSAMVGIGGNADIGFGLVLDWLSRDAETGAILLDIRHLRDPRRFVSAARAAARVRPVVALRAGTRLADPAGLEDATFDAVLRRCGVVGVEGMADLLAAAETLTRARGARGEGLAIVTNAIGPAQLAADAVLRDGLALADLSQETRRVVELARPGAFGGRAADAVPGSRHIVYAGPDEAVRLAEIAALLAGAAEVGGVLLVHAPTGAGDAAGMVAIGAAAAAMKVPLLVCAMGETTGAGHRLVLAGAGVPAFASPEEAVRGFRHLVQHRRIRAAARELPDSVVPDLGIDHAAARAVLAAAGTVLAEGEAAALLGAYGIGVGGAPGAVALRVEVGEDAMFGPRIAFGLGGEAGALRRDVAVDLPPLNHALAAGLVGQTGVAATIATVPGGLAAVGELLVRVAQMVVDVPRIAEMVLDPVHLGGEGVRVARARVVLREAGVGRLAISPYPVEWIRTHDGLTIRPIRPEDAAAHQAFFARLAPEDVRYRFFSAMRELSREQVARMTQVDYEMEMALVAERPGAGEILGVARLVRDVEAGEAEFAVIVESAAKGRGVASALMRHLLDWGRSRGVREVVGQVLADNAPMLAFVRKLGFSVRRTPGDADVMVARISL